MSTHELSSMPVVGFIRTKIVVEMRSDFEVHGNFQVHRVISLGILPCRRFKHGDANTFLTMYIRVRIFRQPSPWQCRHAR